MLIANVLDPFVVVATLAVVSVLLSARCCTVVDVVTKVVVDVGVVVVVDVVVVGVGVVVELIVVVVVVVVVVEDVS